MPPPLRLHAVAFVSAQNHPILIRTFSANKQNELKYHYIAHTSLDVIEERVAAAPKNAECYLGLLYCMEELAVYGYITPTRVKIILAFALSDAVVRDADVTMIFKAMHMAYYRSIGNPFLKLRATVDLSNDQTVATLAGGSQWAGFQRRVDDIANAVGLAA